MAPTVNKKTKVTNAPKLSGKGMKSAVLAALDDELDLIGDSSGDENEQEVDEDDSSSRSDNDQPMDDNANQSESDDVPIEILTPPATGTKKRKRRSKKSESIRYVRQVSQSLTLPPSTRSRRRKNDHVHSINSVRS
jgi:hypothetical protein